MNSEFQVVTDLGEITSLNKELGKQLARTFRYHESREITYPSGHFSGLVYFQNSSGQEVPAWHHTHHPDKLMNFILFGAAKSTHWLEISLQLNFPAGKYSRAFAGAFVKDARGEVFIAHRGKLTKGNAGLKRSEVLGEFAEKIIEAGDGQHLSPLILIASLKDSNLAKRLWEFAREARNLASALAARRSTKDANRTGTGRAPSPPGIQDSEVHADTRAEKLLKLRKYYDEYAGIGEIKGHGGGKRTVEHGDVVKALEAVVRKRGETQKSQAIDLAVVMEKSILLFEVKTSAQTTSVYTGVGQLLLHGESIAQLLKQPVERYLVLPERPSKEHEKHMLAKGAMRIVRYQKIDDGYRFEGLSR